MKNSTFLLTSSMRFKNKLDHHNENYAGMLVDLVASQSKLTGGVDDLAEVNAEDDSKEEPNENAAESTPETYESVEALKAIDNILDRTPSKEANCSKHLQNNQNKHVFDFSWLQTTVKIASNNTKTFAGKL